MNTAELLGGRLTNGTAGTGVVIAFALELAEYYLKPLGTLRMPRRHPMLEHAGIGEEGDGHGSSRRSARGPGAPQTLRSHAPIIPRWRLAGYPAPGTGSEVVEG
jgi:hypothetical protein